MKFLLPYRKNYVLLHFQIWRKKRPEDTLIETNKATYYEENIPTLDEKKSQQARFPQENVYRQR